VAGRLGPHAARVHLQAELRPAHIEVVAAQPRTRP
jgi:hypothetical protein